jgi:hypothetical protein
VIDNADRHPRLVNLASGKFIPGLDPSFDPRVWAVDSYYGFGDSQGNGVVAINEAGQKVRIGGETFSGTRKLTANANVAVVSALAVNRNNEWETRLTVYGRAGLRQLWTRSFGQYSDPLLSEEDGGLLFVSDHRVSQAGDESITYALDARTGSERWRRSDPGEKRRRLRILPFGRNGAKRRLGQARTVEARTGRLVVLTHTVPSGPSKTPR